MVHDSFVHVVSLIQLCGVTQNSFERVTSLIHLCGVTYVWHGPGTGQVEIRTTKSSFSVPRAKCRYVYICVYILSVRICIYVYTYICTFIYMYAYKYIRIHMYISIYIYICIISHVNILYHTCMYIYLSTYIYAYIYTYFVCIFMRLAGLQSWLDCIEKYTKQKIENKLREGQWRHGFNRLSIPMSPKVIR